MAENRQNVIKLATELIHRSGIRAVNVLRLDVTRADAPDQHRPLLHHVAQIKLPCCHWSFLFANIIANFTPFIAIGVGLPFGAGADCHAGRRLRH